MSRKDLVLRLRELYPDSQTVRAKLVGVDQTTFGRWEKAADNKQDPKMGPSSEAKIRNAVRAAELGGDYARGVRVAVARVEDALEDLRKMLPVHQESDASIVAAHVAGEEARKEDEQTRPEGKTRPGD